MHATVVIATANFSSLTQATMGDGATIALILSYKADVNMPGEYNRTALHWRAVAASLVAPFGQQLVLRAPDDLVPRSLMPPLASINQSCSLCASTHAAPLELARKE